MRIIALLLASVLVIPVLGCILDSSGDLIIESSERENPFWGGINTTGGFSLSIKNYADSGKHPEINITVPDFIQLYLESPGIATGPEDVEPVIFEEVGYDGDYRIYNLKPVDPDYKLGGGEEFSVYFTVWTDDVSSQETGRVELYGNGKLTDDRRFDWKVNVL